MMIHHDHENSCYWGNKLVLHEEEIYTPNTYKEILNVIIDIKTPIKILNDLIKESISEGEFCEELKSKVVWYICLSLLSFVKDHKSIHNVSSENMDKAIYSMLDYGVNEQKAAQIFHTTETALMRCFINIIPEIDDERKYAILDYKILDKDGLYLSLEIIDD